MPFSPLRPDPDQTILHVYGAVPLSAMDPFFDVQLDLVLSSWLDIPGTFTFGWLSTEPEHAGLVELAIFPPGEGLMSGSPALLALTVRETALFTPELRSQILLLLP